MKKPEAARPLPSDPRFELAFEARPSPPSLIAGLKALGERGGAALGSAYAVAARAVLGRIERFEDANAERRFEQQLGPPTSAARTPAPAARAQQSSSPSK